MSKNKVSIIILFLSFILFFSICLDNSYGVSNSPDLPQWRIGDWWKVDIEISGEVTLVGVITFTVVNDNIDFFQNEKKFNCYQIDLSGGGTLHGDVDDNRLEGIWIATERQYYTKSDQSWVAVYSTYEETISFGDDSGTTQILLVADEIISKTTYETTYNPPFEANKGFPLTVGKSWIASTTETTKTETNVNGIVESSTISEAYTKTFEVIRKETLALPMGKVETYVTKRTDPDGVYAESYYSPEVGFDVKQIDYYSNGTIQRTLELVDYEYLQTGDDPQFSTIEIFQILVVTSIIAISVIAAIYFLKKQKADTQYQNNDIASLALDSSIFLPDPHTF
jgi:hypothetical protein